MSGVTGLCITPRNLFCMLLVPKKRAMEPQSGGEYNGQMPPWRGAHEGRYMTTCRLRRPPKRRTLGLKLGQTGISQRLPKKLPIEDAKKYPKTRNMGGDHADQPGPHLCTLACSLAGDGGLHRLRPGYGADELAAQSVSLGGKLGQAAGRAAPGARQRQSISIADGTQRLGRRALRRVRAAEPDGPAIGTGQALCLRGLEPRSDPEIRCVRQAGEELRRRHVRSSRMAFMSTATAMSG